MIVLSHCILTTEILAAGFLTRIVKMNIQEHEINNNFDVLNKVGGSLKMYLRL